MKIFNFMLILCILFLAGCEGCSSDFADQELGNGNDDPEILNMELYGDVLAGAIRSQLGPADCDPPSDFIANVEIEIRTASIDTTTGIVTFDPDPYYEYEDDRAFSAGSSPESATLFNNIQVPETGAYAIIIEVEMDYCSKCCHGNTDDRKCSDKQRYDQNDQVWYCEAGKPQLKIEQTFLSAFRPPHEYNWSPGVQIMNVRNCRQCGCEVLCDD